MIHKLLEQMTLEEKISQLIQLSPDFYSPSGEITGPLNDVKISQSVVENAGSILGVCGADEVLRVQKLHLSKNRLKIPLLFMADIIHGYKTIFPVPLASACSFNLDLIKESAKIAAAEASISGLHVTFAPMADLAKDPRWGRVMESAGEDPYYNSLVSSTYVEGFQAGNQTDSQNGLISCVKHFAGYGSVEAGRDYNYVDMSKRELFEKHMPAYKSSLNAGAKMVMTSFNTIEGMPASGNEWLLKDVLRKQFKFDGIIISDWGSVRELIAHGVAHDEYDAAKLAMNATLDIEMMTNCYVSSLHKLVDDGIISISQIDQAVLRILNLKEQLGLFENPYRILDSKLESQIVFSNEHRNIAYKLASESCVLLKNEKRNLPLAKSDKIALIGPVANSRDLLGPWCWKGDQEQVVTIKEAFEENFEIRYAKGSTYHKTDSQMISLAMDACLGVDKIIMCLGEDTYQSGEANCVSTIKISQAQIELAKALSKLQIPMTLVLVNGRPLDLTELEPLFESILETWFVGSAGGHVIYDLLCGNINPSGKLTMSFPYNAGQIPVYYNTYHTGRPYIKDNAYTTKYLDIPNEPRYAFGYGLSYTKIKIDDVQISSNKINKSDQLHIKVTVSNQGHCYGQEVLQLYIQDTVGKVVRPVKELKRFKKIGLDINEKTEVCFTITNDDLLYYDSNLNLDSDFGLFKLFVGFDSNCSEVAEFELVK